MKKLLFNKSGDKIVGIGVDCEEISRFKPLVSNIRIVSKILSDKEFKFFRKKGEQQVHFVAGRFVAKESIIKALSAIISRLDMRDINIKYSKNKQPVVEINNPRINNKSVLINISISHCQSLAMAFCVAFRK